MAQGNADDLSHLVISFVNARSRFRSRSLRAASAPRRLDGGDVDLLHVHHRIERALGLSAAGRKSIGQHARRDLPGDAPLVLALAAVARLAAIADDGVPVAVGLRLIVGRIWNEKASLCLKAGPPLRPIQGTPATVNSTTNTSPALVEGLSLGARWIAPTALSGKVAA